jgi:multimeric flavodoxin WrbA
MKYLIICGSSGSKESKTNAIVTRLKEYLSADLIDVSTSNISFFDYEHKNQDDDFDGFAHQMIKADSIIFVTPVYWSAMSAQLKIFFDRFSDLIMIKKPLGRQLKGRVMTFLATGHDDVRPEGFAVPFKRTAEYFHMIYKEGSYICTNSKTFNPDETEVKVVEFADTLCGSSDN